MHKVAGVVGWPVSHSLSPRLHSYWLKHYGIDGEYRAVEVPVENLAEEIKKLVGEDWQGFNLTIPHKESIMPLLDSVDAEAHDIGAVNTVVIREGKLIGSNTDAYGFAENIRPHIKGKNKALVIGAGGAAKAVCHALVKEGFASIIIANRTYDKAKAITAHYANSTAIVWEKRIEALADADILVNTSSLGMKGKEPLDIDLLPLPKTALVTDIVYAPLVTPLLKAAQARGNPVVDGLGMLLHQAVPGFEAWFGVKPEVTAALRQHVLSK